MIELALIAVMAIGSGPGEGSVQGTILSDHDEPVAGVRIEIPAENVLTWSDSKGGYGLDGLEPGDYQIRFSQFAYDPLALTITVPEKGSLRLDVKLRTRFVAVPAISVVTEGTGSVASSALQSSGLPEVGSRELPVGVMWSSPLVGQPDVLTALRTIAGIDMAEEGATPIHVRGGSADENLVLLDGVPVYNGYHTSGILSAISPDAVSRILVHAGVFPARYGGRLSSVVDVTTPTPGREGIRVRGGVGLPDIRTAIEAPLPGDIGGVLLVGRRTTYDLIRRGYSRGTESSGFEDVLGKVSVKLLGGTFEVVSLHTDNWLSSLAGEEDVTGESGTALVEQLVSDMHNTVGWSGGTDAISWIRSSERGRETQLRLWRATTRSSLEWGSIPERHRMNNRLKHWGASGDVAWRNAASVGRLGLAVEWLSSAYSAESNEADGTVGLSAPVYRLEGRPRVVSSYVEHRWIPWDRWMLNNGMRVIHVEGHGLGLEPRFSAHYRPNARVMLSGGYGRVHQYVQSLTNEESLLSAAYAIEPLVAAGRSGVPVGRSDQLTAALEAKLAGPVLLTVDGYARWIDDIVLVAPMTPQPFATAGFERGEGTAYGLGAGVVYRGDRADAEAIVEWSSVRRNYRGENSSESSRGVTYNPRFQRRQSIALAASYRVTPKTTLRTAFQVAAGLPTSPLQSGFDWESFDQMSGEVEFSGTPVRAPGPLNDEKLPPYVRLDLGIRREWRLKGRGQEGSITTYLDVLNVLSRKNVLGYQFAPSGSETRELPLLPTSVLMGIEWRF